MNYEETIRYLYSAAPAFENAGASAYKEGLQNTLALDSHYNHPHRCFRTIHVAGTNGKGTTSHTLASILMEDGYKVGLYTSPHLVDFRERIRINGKMMPKDYVVKFVEEGRKFFEPLHPSFFELTTAMAFCYFAEMGADIVVVEVGMGGRLDCTNIITPCLSVITNVSLDHTQFLGHTLTEIAAEKGGVIKNGVPVVVGEYCDETRGVFLSLSKERNAECIFASDAEQFSINHSLPHTVQLNGQTIMCAADVLLKQGVIRDGSSIERGMTNMVRNTDFMGRWTTISMKPQVVCDTGHNPAAWQWISEQLKKATYSTLRVVFGMMADKDVKAVVELLPANALYYIAAPDNHRAMPVNELAALLQERNLQCHVCASPADAFAAAKSEAEENDLIFIGGSNYLLADVLKSMPKR